MDINVLLVDDDKNAINLLKSHLSAHSFVTLKGEVHSGKEAMEFIRNEKVDLMFLDIEMNDITGLELAKHIQALQKNIEIIFVTGHAGFALEGYDFHPIDFLLKPIDFFRLEKTMAIVQERFQGAPKADNQNKKIGMRVAGGIKIFNVEDIIYIEKIGRKVSIVTKFGSFESSDTISAIEDMFETYGFYRPHQSFIVPMHNIRSINSDSISRTYTLELTNGTLVPLSRNKVNELKDLLVAEGIVLV